MHDDKSKKMLNAKAAQVLPLTACLCVCKLTQAGGCGLSGFIAGGLTEALTHRVSISSNKKTFRKAVRETHSTHFVAASSTLR